jgi:hypothetical protein
MDHPQFATVLILDARLRELRAETHTSLESLAQELKRDVLRSHTRLEARVDRINGELDAKIDRKCLELEARTRDLQSRMERAELFRLGLLVMLANVAVSVGAAVVLNAFRHLR